jgi:2-oxoglutarate dehydrogenase complex dihydrolipoamide succinyltransferase (E2) component
MALVDVIMPQLGESIAEGTISKWHKKKGDAIAKDETLLEISTDKVDSEIPSPAAGIVEALLFPEQETVSVLTIIARIQTDVTAAGTSSAEDAPPSAGEVPARNADHEAAPMPAARSTAQDGSGEQVGGRFYSPLVVNIARSENIRMDELDRISGSGVSGRVSKKDVLAYLERKKSGTIADMPSASGAQPAAMPHAPSISPAPSVRPESGAGDVRIVMDTMRRSIAEHMVRSKQVSPHVYSVTEADVSNIVAYRDRVKSAFEQREGMKLTLTPFFLDATVKALREFPYLNASIDGDAVIVKKHIHLGVAVAVEKGLIVPVIRHAEEKNLAGLARSVADLAGRARTKKLLPDEVQGGTFTVTNPGMVGNLYGIPIINQPQVAILAIGVVKKRTVVVDDAIAIRSMVYLSLSFDHRIIDGMQGGKFLERIVELLEKFDMGAAL